MYNFDGHPNCRKGHNYALDVVSGKILACKYVTGTCLRYLKDLERDDLSLDLKWAEKFMRMFQKFEHVIGEWETPNIKLEPWQCFMFLNIEGFYWKINKKRKYKEAMIEVSRGNGKSSTLSVVGLIYLALYRTVKGNKVYAASTKKDQSKIILKAAQTMASKNPSFIDKTGVQVFAHTIEHRASGSEFEALASDTDGLDGLQPILAIIDELHAHKTREIYDVMSSAMSKRSDSMLFCITTAGFRLEGIGYSQSCYSKKVALGEINDEAFFSLVYTLDEKDDWKDEAVWIKANPNLCISVDIDALKSKSFKAQNNPQDETNFKVKHLNMWQNAASQFFNIKKWEANADKNLLMENFYGKKCYVGIDLASKVDLVSIAYIFYDPETTNYHAFTKNYVPEETIKESRNAMYPVWRDSGEIIETQGEAINYPKLEEDFKEDAKNFDIEAAHYDPWNATQFAQNLSKESIEMLEFRMNVSNMSEPMKMLDALIKEGRFIHNGSALLSWCLGNVVAKVDANDNVYPRKEHESMKIDPIVAIIMALAGWVQEQKNKSVYDERPMIFF